MKSVYDRWGNPLYVELENNTRVGKMLTVILQYVNTVTKKEGDAFLLELKHKIKQIDEEIKFDS